MKKTVLIVALVLAALSVMGVGVAFAQSASYSPELHGGGRGVLHPFIVEAFAQKLDLTVDDVNARLAGGETLRDIALSTGVAEADLPALMDEVRNAALDAAVEAGVITQAQADKIRERGFRHGGGGNGNCGGGHGNGNSNGGGSNP